MSSRRNPGALAGKVSGHLQVKGPPRARKYFASWVDIDGVKHFKTLGKAHVRDSGKRTSCGAVIWRAGDGACPAGALTPQAAEARLAAILDDAQTPLSGAKTPPSSEALTWFKRDLVRADGLIDLQCAFGDGTLRRR